MAGITSWIGAGFDAFQWSLIDDTANCMSGKAGLTALSTGTASPMGRYIGASSAPFAIPAGAPVTVLGDNRPLGDFDFGSDGSIAFTISMNAMDSALLNAVQGTVNVTKGDSQFTPILDGGYVKKRFFLLLSRDLQSKVSGQIGAKGFSHLEIFNAQLTYLGSGFDYRGVEVHQWQVTCNPSDNLPTGKTVVSEHTETETLRYRIHTTDKRYTYVSFVGDGLIDDIPVPYKPISVAKSASTVETTGFADNVVSGVVTTSPYTIGVTTMPASGKFAVVGYEFATNWV
jgi:hypothetical protein